MKNKRIPPIFRKSAEIRQEPGRRAGTTEKWLLEPGDSTLQNVLLVKTDAGAVVEYHEVGTSESLFVLEGVFEVLYDDPEEENDRRAFRRIEPGDFCSFPPHSG